MRAGWLFILLAAVLIITFSFYPMFQALLLSFQQGKGNNLTFAGLGNYKKLFSDKLFLRCLFNTFIYVIFQIPIMLVLALTYAHILNDKTIRFKGFFRTCLFLPCCISLVSSSMIFRSLFATGGVVNQTLQSLGIINSPVGWLTEAWPARFVIILAITWRWTGYNMIFYIAGMQNIDYEIYEAASIDGATGMRQFFSITVPLLKPIILLTSIMSTNGTLQLFDESRNITNGQPGDATRTISHLIYVTSFEKVPSFGYAATMSFAIFFMVAVLTAIQMGVGGKRDG